MVPFDKIFRPVGCVKEDADSAAEIEISLNWDSSGKQKIKCVIERDAADPSYFVNGEPSEREHVVDMAKSANINPGNMCQILSQEKVGQFCRMDHKVLFRQAEN